ncbi:GJ13428, partial [Phyllosticta capitalensis]
VRRGANKAAKTLNCGIAENIVLAADTLLLAIPLHLPLLCKAKNVPCVYIASEMALSQAYGVSRAVLTRRASGSRLGGQMLNI